MALPHLLLVDDSEAILAFETAVLGGHYRLTHANNGREALDQLRGTRPDGVLLDLSMPEMGGAEVLASLRADPRLASLPVLIITSEIHRKEEMQRAGADGFLGKPLKGEFLLEAVSKLLLGAADRARQGGLAALFLTVGKLEVGVPLLTVERVMMQPSTSSLPGGPTYLSRMFVYQGDPVGLLDLATRLGVVHLLPFVERKVLMFDRRVVPFAIQVDQVEDPETFEAGDIRSAAELGLIDAGALGELVTAVVRTERGLRPIIDPRTLVSRRALQELPALVRELHGRSFVALANAATALATDGTKAR